MAKRHARVKLSKAQKLENELNRWLARKDAAINMLVKAMGKLKELDRAHARMQRTAQLPAAAADLHRDDNLPYVEHPRVEAKAQTVADALVEDTPVPPKPKRKRNGKAAVDEGGVRFGPDEAVKRPQDLPDHATRMRTLGFRPTSKRASKPAG